MKHTGKVHRKLMRETCSPSVYPWEIADLLLGAYLEQHQPMKAQGSQGTSESSRRQNQWWLRVVDIVSTLPDIEPMDSEYVE
jgi:hypothetical protein